MSEWLPAILAAFCIAMRGIGLVLLSMEIQFLLRLLHHP
jgi:hypothetical protein